MFRNYMTTALRNMARNGLYSAISILGLAIALTAAILITQFVRHEFSYDTWIPGHEQIYKVTHTLERPGKAPSVSDMTQSGFARALKLAAPGVVVEAVRLDQDFPEVRRSMGDTPIIDQTFAWVDPGFFTVFPFPVVEGDPGAALGQPNTLVLTRKLARKYFGSDRPIGQTLYLDGHPMQVGAVLADLPSNTNFVAEMFASTLTADAPLVMIDANPSLTVVNNYTFVRVAKTATSADLQQALAQAGRPYSDAFRVTGLNLDFQGVPIAQAHMQDPGLTATLTKPVGNKATTVAIGVVAVLIVLIAAINFVTLMTARAARRAVEVGIRKASGAQRSDLVLQFMGEALLQVVIAMIIALPLTAILVKPFNAFVQRELTFDLLRDPALVGGVIFLTLAIGFLAGAYPALVLSSFRPAAVLKGGVVRTAGSALARQGLVVIQFAVLVGLIVTTTTIYRQTQFALKQGMGAEGESIIQIRTRCRDALPAEVRRLSGVRSAACSSLTALNTPNVKILAPGQARDGGTISFNIAQVYFGWFELYNIKPLAGRLFLRDRAGDDVLTDTDGLVIPPVIINETAAKNVGFDNPKAAVGQRINWTFERGDVAPTMISSEIIGVVPDIPVTVRAPAEPMIYYVTSRQMDVLSIKLTGADIPGAIAQIERLWRQTGHTDILQIVYFAQVRQKLYLDVIVQAVIIGIAAIMAVLIACLGLFALSAFTTERRTKEIGIRKVMGATTFDVVKLLLWQFTIPVLWAIGIALPISYACMQRWLSAFSYRVDVSVWMLLLAALASLVIAWFTVSFQTFMVARAKPASALRYE